MPVAVTLDDIARAAGLSKATVSRALSGHPRVAVVTRERVAAVARELGYRPDAALSALARRRWPDGRRPASSQLLYLHNLRRNTRERLDRYARIAAELGYELEVDHLDQVTDPVAYGRQLDERGVRGVILHSIHDESDGAPRFKRCARVVIGFGFEDLQAHRVMADLGHNLQLAVDQVVGRGYRRIGFLGTITASQARRRLVGDQFQLRRWHLQRELGPQPALHWYQHDHGPEALERWLQRERPDAVVADHVDRCESLLALGSALPRGLGLVGLVNRSRTAPGEPLSQVNVRRQTVFRHALHILHDALLREEYGSPDVPVRILIPGRWHEGRTLPGR